jgi:hypothetical protein
MLLPLRRSCLICCRDCLVTPVPPFSVCKLNEPESDFAAGGMCGMLYLILFTNFHAINRFRLELRP